MAQIENERGVYADENDKAKPNEEYFSKTKLLSHRTDGQTSITGRMPCSRSQWV